jgi:uncharacterized sodium:solute symporter family permease YidK
MLSESLRGGITVGVVAALMATFANIFSSTSSLVTFDFYRSMKRSVSDRELVLIGRMTTMLLVVISILLIPAAQAITFRTSLTLFKIFAYFASMVAAIFLVSLVNSKIDAWSALVAFCVATAVIIIRSVTELFYQDSVIENTLIQWLLKTGFLEFSVFIFLFSVLFLVSFYRVRVSFITGLISKKHKTVF